MNILLHQSQFNYNYIYFKEKIKNTVYNNSNFCIVYRNNNLKFTSVGTLFSKRRPNKTAKDQNKKYYH